MGGNSVRFGTIFNNTDILIANPRRVVFESEAKVDVRLTYKHGSDLAVVSYITKIIIDNDLIDVNKAKSAIDNYDDLVESLTNYSVKNTKQLTGLPEDVLTKAAERFARDADRFVLIGNDVLDTGQGEEVLNALLNLCTLVNYGSTGSVSIYPPREHCNSQGVNDMGLTPDFLPGYIPYSGEKVSDLLESCKDGSIKCLYIAGEDPIGSFYKPQLVKEALTTVPFLIVTDVFMTETAKKADLILPSSTYAEKEGTYTNMSRHVQAVAPAVLPQGTSKPDFDILIELAEALGKPFESNTLSEIQQEIETAAPIYQGTFPGNESKQWKPNASNKKPLLKINSQDSPSQSESVGFPFTLQTNNHMFHIGNYSQYAKALVEIGPECIAEINPDDAKELGINSGDQVVIESLSRKVQVKIKTTKITTPGMVYIPKNWTEVPVNDLRNGEEGLINVKVSKAG